MTIAREWEVRVVYLRPGSLFRLFHVERLETVISDTGRNKTAFVPTGEMVCGVLSDAKTSEKLRWQQLQHPVTHTVVQKNGDPKAKAGDRLVHGGRSFYVQGVDDASMLGLFTLYYVEERSDRIV